MEVTIVDKETIEKIEKITKESKIPLIISLCTEEENYAFCSEKVVELNANRKMCLICKSTLVVSDMLRGINLDNH